MSNNAAAHMALGAHVPSRSTTADFTILQELGKGSYGVVQKVQRKQDKQYYALKVVNIKKLQPREREDAVNEIRVLASIKHRNIVRYCDAFVEKDSLHIVMEFAEHGDIGRQIEKFKKANKYIKEDTIWMYLIQICAGLQSMHSRNVLHRDMKAKNVFLTGKNQVRLGDLGCAKLLKAGMARTQIGTPYYMSPEIWANKPYDAKSDVWATGCLIYELCMLQPPFLANDMNGLGAKIKTTTAPRISKHYSEDLANLVASMLAKDPRARPSVNDVLSSMSVQAKMSLVPQEDESEWAGEGMRQQMISTIKVPVSFGYGGHARGSNGGLNLPAPSFPSAPVPRPVTSPAKLSSAPEPVSVAAPAAQPIPESRPVTAAVAPVSQPQVQQQIAAIVSKENLAAAPKAVVRAVVKPTTAAPVVVAKRPLSAVPSSAANNVAAPLLPTAAAKQAVGGAVAAYGGVKAPSAPVQFALPHQGAALAARPHGVANVVPLVVPDLRNGAIAKVGFAANAVAAAPRYNNANAGLIARYGGPNHPVVISVGARPVVTRPW